ncbi:MAG: PDZ domain-containing protein [Clostridiales bacterium]|jgi:carboxyl-terminal processing protease|nr:PDZ domain-containing protein [Clostridiales bacterium]
MKRISALKANCIALVLVLIISIGVTAAGDKIDYGEKLDEIIGLFQNVHVYASEDEDPIRKGLISMFEKYPDFFNLFINEVFQSYDRYSYYFSDEVYEVSYPKYDTFVGIGITIKLSEDGCYIDRIYDGPAMAAGLLAGDKLVAVDGQNLEGYTPSMVGDLISGPEGSPVEITVLRDGQDMKYTVNRGRIAVSNVAYKDLGDGVGYFKISRFADASTFMEFIMRYESLPEAGINTVILDLRDNPGGSFDCLINMMDGIIPEKDIPYLMTWQSKPTMQVNTFVSEGYGWEFNKLVILVNEKTASAAEIMAGALKDLGYADVVGTRTYGKGLGQLHIKLSDSNNAIISTSEMMLPTTGKYDGVGITPNIIVEQKLEPYIVPPRADLMLDRGVLAISNYNVLGVEQRLKELGFFEDKPDDTADFKTFHAINQFQKENGLKITKGYCDAATVKAIDRAALKLAEKPVMRDTQYERALALARKHARSGEKAKAIPLESIRFAN